MDLTLIKIRVNAAHVGKDAFFPMQILDGKLSDLSYGAELLADLKQIQDKRKRSHEQLALYKVGCRFIASISNNKHFNTQKKVDSQCKLHCHLIEDSFSYKEKNGDIKVQFMLGSVSYAKLPHLEACGYFSDAFDYQTEIYNLIQKRNNPDYQNISKDEYTDLLKQYIANNYNEAMGL